MIRANVPLAALSTFKIGGPAEFYAEATSAEELQQLFEHASAHGLQTHIIGNGSNLLFPDEGLAGLVIKNKIDFTYANDPLLEVGAGTSFARLGVQTARAGWSGLEFACGIPGSVGGAIFMNAGAGGQDVASVLHEVRTLNRTYARSELEFSYRTSPFQSSGEVILSATFQLTPSTSARTSQEQLLKYRIETQPYGEPSAGCIFRNPECSSAGRLIEQCGLKGFQIGGARVSTQHANFIVNSGTATCRDVLSVVEHVQQEVERQTGVRLHMEVNTPSSWNRSSTSLRPSP